MTKPRKKVSRTRVKFDKITGTFYKEMGETDYFKLIDLIINEENGISKNKLAENIFGKSDDDEVNLWRRMRVNVIIHAIRSRFQIWFITEIRWIEGKRVSFVRLATTPKDLIIVKKKYVKHINHLKGVKKLVEFDMKNFEQYKERLERLKKGTFVSQTIKKP